MGSGPFIGFDVARELFVDAGAADLDRDLAAVGRHRAVDLRDRGRSDGFGIELAIKAFQRDLERRLDFLLNPVERDGCERVLQREQIMRDILADEIRSKEQTYELQSLMRISYAVLCLKKKTN